MLKYKRIGGLLIFLRDVSHMLTHSITVNASETKTEEKSFSENRQYYKDD